MVAYVTKSINKLYLFVSEEGENELIQTEVEGEEENEVEEDVDDEEISKILFGISIVNSPIYKKQKDGRRGIKTPQKNIITKLFSKEINEGTAPKKARVVNVQEQIGWLKDISYKIIKSFVANAGKVKNKKRGKQGDKLESDEDE